MGLSIFFVILFYLFCIVGGFVGFSLLYRMLPSLKDRGYAFSRLFFFILLSYTVWLFSSFKILSFSFPTILIVFLIFTLVAIIIGKRQNFESLHFLKKNKKLITFEEILFFLFFAFFLLVRLGNPDLWHPYMGGEKPMDVAFINGILNSTNLPPNDPWLSGHTINYYYFGHFIVATLIKLLSIPTSYFYNIFLPFLFAQSAIIVFSLLYTITHSKFAGVLSSFLLLFVGNLGQPKLILESLEKTVPINSWYWNATRIMPNFEINEFPFFSFLYADLHSHVIALPIAIVILCFLYQLYIDKKFTKTSLFNMIIIGILLGILRMTNVWDYPTFFAVVVIVVASKFLDRLLLKSLLSKLLKLTGITLLVFLVSSLSILPFLLSFKTGPLGLSVYTGEATKITDYLLIHGLFLMIFIVYLLIKSSFSLRKIEKRKRMLLILPITFFALLFFSGYYFLSFLAFFLILLSYALLNPNNEKKEVLILIFSGIAIFLTIVPDIIDLKLGLGRMNTVFKFYFQAWIFYAISCAFFFFQTFKTLQGKLRILYTVVIVMLFGMAFSYVPTATYAKINDRMSQTNRLTLDGMDFMKNSVYYDQGRAIQLISDYEAILWIRKNVKPYEIILEANTPIYRWGSRVSIHTGNPTVLGWDWHEIAHRQYLSAGYIHSRANDIKTVYESEDLELTEQLLNDYEVSYIYLGQLEKLYYNTQGIEKVLNDSPKKFIKVYSTSDVAIYKYINGKYN